MAPNFAPISSAPVRSSARESNCMSSDSMDRELPLNCSATPNIRSNKKVVWAALSCDHEPGYEFVIRVLSTYPMQARSLIPADRRLRKLLPIPGAGPYLIALVLVAAALLVRLLLSPLIGNRIPFLLFALA